MSAQVKVRAASLNGAAEGAVLKLTTADGPDIEFLLDDLAVALLSFTASYVVKEIKDRVDTPVIFKATSNQ